MKFKRFISVLTVASLLLSSVYMTAKTDDTEEYKTKDGLTVETAEINTQKEDMKNVSSTVSTVSNVTVDVIKSGTCGVNLTWDFFSDGTLQISGTGNMTNYSLCSAPWYSLWESLKKVIIENGVTSIGEYAFYNCNTLASVTISDSVTSIGSGAFFYCSKLTYIRIPHSITSIGNQAFSNCSSLTSISISNGVTNIGYGAFSYCSSLTSITLPNTVISIGERAFEFSSQLSFVLIPDSVTSIGDHAFFGCSNLTSITIGDSVKIIGNDAFNGCSSITSITIPDSVTSIGDYAFSSCFSFTNIIIPKNVNSIGKWAFNGCSNLTSITIGDGVKNINEYAFEGCLSLTSVTIGDGVTNISAEAFSFCSTLTSVYTTSLESWCNITFDSANSNPLSQNSNSKLYLNGEVVTHLDIPIGVTKINDYAFYDAECITSVVIPEGVEVIGSDAFYDCYNIETMTLPKSLMKINDNAFSGCYSIKKVYYAGSETEWNEIVKTSGNDYLKNAEIIYGVSIDGEEEETVSYVAIGKLGTAEWALLENSMLVINGKGTPTFSELPFYKYRDTITVVKISDGITTIPEDMFYKCNNITSVIIPASVTKISDSAFWRCNAITDVYYCGTEVQWAKIQIDEYNDSITTSGKLTYNYTSVTVESLKTLTKTPKTTYTYGEELDIENMHVALFYSDRHFEEVEDFTVSGYDKCTFGHQEVTVSYEDQSFTMNVFVKPTEPNIMTKPLKAGTTVAEFSAPYSMFYTVYVFDDGMTKQLSDDDIITSGCVVQLVRDKKVMDSIGIVVSGDATCDGIINGKDLIRIKKQIISGNAVEYIDYADINCDGIINDTDLECLINMMAG